MPSGADKGDAAVARDAQAENAIYQFEIGFWETDAE